MTDNDRELIRSYREEAAALRRRIERLTTCETCDGTGSIGTFRWLGEDSDGHHYEQTGEEDCPDCHCDSCGEAGPRVAKMDGVPLCEECRTREADEVRA